MLALTVVAARGAARRGHRSVEEEAAAAVDPVEVGRRSTGCRRRGSSCSGRATSGSWSPCRCSSPTQLGWSDQGVGAFLAAVGDRVRHRAVVRAAAARTRGGARSTRCTRRSTGRSCSPRVSAADRRCGGARRRRHHGRRGRADRVRRRVRDELVAALVPGARLLRRRRGRTRRRASTTRPTPPAAGGHPAVGVLYLWGDLAAALWGSAAFVVLTWLLALRLPPHICPRRAAAPWPRRTRRRARRHHRRSR
jgi:hypothetical protein